MTITRTARGNCDHLPCQIPVSLQGECELIESTEATPNGWIGAGITRVAAERARVESLNRHMTYAMMSQRTAMWKGIV